jgi:hypothetical protein
MEKSFVLTVSAQVRCYRHIQISENATLYELHGTILESFYFFDDHLHAFFMDNRPWDDSEAYVTPRGDLDSARGFSDDVKLSDFHLCKDNKFLYIFDFGDDWRFRIKVLRVIEELTEKPIILKSLGQISQYGDDENF